MGGLGYYGGSTRVKLPQLPQKPSPAAQVSLPSCPIVWSCCVALNRGASFSLIQFCFQVSRDSFLFFFLRMFDFGLTHGLLPYRESLFANDATIVP